MASEVASGPHPLNRQERALLLDLGDPQRTSLPAFSPDLSTERFGAMTAHHRLVAIARRKLARAGDELPERFARYRDSLEEAAALRTAVTLDLEQRAATIGNAFEQAGVSHSTVKGERFAALYPDPADRPFTDVDILVAPSDLDRAGHCLTAMGYEQKLKKRFDRSHANREQKWLLPGHDWILIELHTDLVHMTALRRRVQYDLAAHELAMGTESGPFRGAANLLVATVHAAVGHKFHTLGLLVDVLQAVRHLNERDTEHLASIWKRLRLGPELAQCLELVESGFGETRAVELRRRLTLPEPSRLMRIEDVLDTFADRGHRSRIRRHLFRYGQIIRPRTGAKQ